MSLPDAAAAARVRREGAERAPHRLALEVTALRAEGVASHAGLAQALTARGVATPRGRTVWTHTTVARVLARTAAEIPGSDKRRFSDPTPARLPA